MFKRYLIFTVFLLSSNALCSDFDKFDRLVHIINIKSTKKSSGQSSGTGFVVGRDGRLVTNFHVISKMFKKAKLNKDFQVYVKINKKEYQAKVLKIDILNDLALIKIPYQFKSTVTISKNPIKKGSKIYALGFHDKEFLAINQGVFSDYITDSSSKLMALSMALNSGMSGGPILNSSLEVIGVNVLKSNIKEASSFGINRQNLLTFLQDKISKNISLEDALSGQINKTYGRVMASIEESNLSGSLNSWETPDVEKFLFCGEYDSNQNFDKDEDDSNENQIKVKYKVCNMDHRKVPLSAMGTNINISFAIGNTTASKNTNKLTYYNYLNKVFKFRDFKNIFYANDYNCRKEYIKNNHGTKFKVSVCAFKYDKVPGYIKDKNFYKFDVKAVTSSEEMDDIIVKLQFSGGADLAKTIIKNVLGNIYKKADGRNLATK